MGFDKAADGVFVDLGLADDGALLFAGLHIGAIGVAGIASATHLFVIGFGDFSGTRGGTDGAHKSEGFDSEVLEQDT